MDLYGVAPRFATASLSPCYRSQLLCQAGPARREPYRAACITTTSLIPVMASSVRFLPARSRLATAALLAAPPPNPWLPSPRACTRHLLIPCQASKYNSDRSFDSSRKQGDGSSKCKGSSSSRHTSSSGSTNRAGQQQPRDAALHSPQQHRSSSSKRSCTPDGSSSRSTSSRAKEPAAPVSVPLPPHAPVLVVGAGAAGLTAAYFAAKQGAEVGSGLGCSVWAVRKTPHTAAAASTLLCLSCWACWAVPAGSRRRQCCLSAVLVCTHVPAGGRAGAYVGGGQEGPDVGGHALQRSAS